MAQYSNRFIFGSMKINEMTEYDADEEYISNEVIENDNSSYCNNDCLHCTLECPYKEY